MREEIEHVREGKHGARSAKQAIAIGLSKARRAGVELPPPKKGSKQVKEQAKRDLRKGKKGTKKKSAEAFARNERSFKGRTPQCRFETRIVASGEEGCEETFGKGPVACG